MDMFILSFVPTSKYIVSFIFVYMRLKVDIVTLVYLGFDGEGA